MDKYIDAIYWHSNKLFLNSEFTEFIEIIYSTFYMYL